LDSRSLAIKEAPVDLINDKWIVVAFSESDFSGDKETRISVVGLIPYLMGVPFSWRSKDEKMVILSSSEAVYFALSEAANEIMFVYQLLTGICTCIKMKLPVVVRVDNLGAVFMNETVSE